MRKQIENSMHYVSLFTACQFYACKLSRSVSTRAFRHVRPAKIQINLRITTVLSTSIEKTLFFTCRFVLNENTLFLFLCFVLKLKLRPKIGLTYAISVVKGFYFIFIFFLEILFKKIFFDISLLNLNY